MKPKTLSSKKVRFAFAGYFVFVLPWMYFKFTLDILELDENAIFLEYYRSRIIGVESKPSILPTVVYHDGQKSKEEWRKKNWEERNEDGNVLSGRNWSASVIYYDEESRGESEKEAKLYDKFHSKIEFHRKCELADWSRLPVSNCNLLHEVYQDDYSFLASGGVRDVWAFRSNDSQQQFVIKTLKLSKEFDIQKMEMHRVDALISERLSGSPYVVDIYAYCAQSVINAKISKTIRQLSIKRMKSEEKLRISYEAALAMNATHYFINGEKNPASFIHRDITPKNFIINKAGNIQITDFNAGHIVNSCGFVKKECKRYSSPEECDGLVLTEKIDVYSLGHIFYFLLSGKLPYVGKKGDDFESLITSSHSPIVEIPDGDPSLLSIKRAMDMCYTKNADTRPEANEIVNALSIG